LAALAGAGIAMRPLPPVGGLSELGRVAVTWIGLYTEPSFRSKRPSSHGTS